MSQNLRSESSVILEQFGYKFNESGKLINITNGERFKFNVKENDTKYNDHHYESLCQVLTEYIYDLLQTEGGLEKIMIPVNAAEGNAQGFFFASPNFKSKAKLLILIHGSGSVRAGQWSRKLIVNDSLTSGTQLPFIKRAINEGYGVVVTNTNQNYIFDSSGNKLPIKNSNSPQEHGAYVWKHFILQCKAKHIAIVAHSAGGGVTSGLVNRFKDDFIERVFAIALTDSILSIRYGFDKTLEKHLLKITCNWVANRNPLDTPIQADGNVIQEVSAGTLRHEETSWCAYESIFAFFDRSLNWHLTYVVGQEAEDETKKQKKRDFCWCCCF